MNDNKEPIEIPSLHEVMNRKDDKDNFILTPLSYTDDYLEPFIGERTVRFHYYKHLQAYIDNVNRLKRRLLYRFYYRETPIILYRQLRRFV